MIAIFAVLFAQSTAFANTTYSCGMLKNSAGNAIMGGPGYQIEVGQNDVLLKELTGADEGGPVKTEVIGAMEKKIQEVEFATYELGEVTATIGRVFEGFWRESVTIAVIVGEENYSTECK
jgi:hypothetical protein